MGRMVLLIVGIAAVMTPFLLWGIIAPRSQWRTLRGWQYRHPRLNEPSDAAYAFGRFVNVVGLVVMLVAGWWLIRDTMATGSERARAEAASTLFPNQRAEIVTVSQTAPDADPGGLQPIPLRRYVEADTTKVAGLPKGTRLVVVIDGVFEPKSVAVREDAGSVRVTVLGTCPLPTMCERTDPVTGPYSITGVPVRLAAPLGGRTVLDGTGQPVRA